MPLAEAATFEELGVTARYDVATVVTIPNRVAGTRVTAVEVDRLVKQAIRSPQVAELAEYVLSRFGARPYDELSQIRAIHRALVNGLFYVGDPWGLETLRDGRKLAEKMLLYFERKGPRPLADCDDYTIIGRALIEFIGILSKARVIGTKRPGVYNHIFPMARLKSGRWVGIEATIPGAKVFYAPRSTTVRHFDVPAIAGLGAEEMTSFEKAAVRVLKQTAPMTVERTLRPAVLQLKHEISFVRWMIFGLTGVTLALSYYFIRRAHVRRAA